MSRDLDDELWECLEGGASWEWWEMTADLLEEDGRLEEAELLRSGRRVIIEACPWSHLPSRVVIEQYRIRACTSEELAKGLGVEPSPH